MYKSLADLAPICSAVISQDSINQILRVTRELISDETDRSCDDKTQLMKLLKSVPVIVESLGRIYEQTELFDRNTECLYQVLTQLTKCSAKSEGMAGFGQPNKQLTEEKAVFDFIEALSQPTQAYFDFLF